MRRFSIFLILVLAFSSKSFGADSFSKPEDGVDYDFSTEESKKDRGFYVRFESKSSRDICIPLGEWPASEDMVREGSGIRLGSLHFRSSEVYIEHNGERNPIRAVNFGYCAPEKGNPNGCHVIVESREKLVGFIPYSEFVYDVDYSSEIENTLVFEFYPRFCDE